MSHAYRAFISYSQQDKAWGKRIHTWLETYRVPIGSAVDLRLPDRLGKFFRDEEDMPAASDIAVTVRDALQGSESLIVICSPRSAKSKWVNAEIQHFRRTGRGRKVFAVIIDGTPNSGDPETECFPPALRAAGDPDDPDALPVEPMGLDVRIDGRERICARLAAGFLDVNFDDLWRRDLRRRQENQIRIAAAAALAVAALTIVYANQAGLKLAADKAFVYGPHLKTAAALANLSPGSAFQDCRQGTNDCPVMVILPEGKILMDPDNGQPPQPVTLPRLAVGRYAVTFDEWEVCAARGGCTATPQPEDFGMGRGQRPVVGVSRHDAQAYTDWLSRMTGQTYRLLTQTEWEYAARAGAVTRYAWGDDFFVGEVTRANCYICTWGGNTPQGTVPVGSFGANAFGLHDMAGNVWEWLEDCYIDPADLVFEPGGGAPPEDTCRNYLGSPGHGPGSGLPREVARLLGGGSWRDGKDEADPAVRINDDPGTHNDTYGFRVARTIGPR